MQAYSVLLLYPAYASDEVGRETYLAHVTASDPKQAYEGAGNGIVDERDFFVLLTVAGHVADLTED